MLLSMSNGLHLLNKSLIGFYDLRSDGDDCFICGRGSSVGYLLSVCSGCQ